MDSMTYGNKRTGEKSAKQVVIPNYIGFHEMREPVMIVKHRDCNALLINCEVFDHEWLLRDSTGIAAFILGRAYDDMLDALACCVFCNPTESFISKNRGSFRGIVRFWLTEPEGEHKENVFEEKFNLPFLEDNI